MSQYPRIALYISTQERFLFDGFAHFTPQFSEPAVVDTDRFGLESLIEPASAPYNKRWATRGQLTFLRPRFMLRHGQALSGGSWNYLSADNKTLVEWLFANCIEARTLFSIFVAGRGGKQGGAAYQRNRYYAGKVTGLGAGNSAYEWLWGDLAGSTGAPAPRWLTLPFLLTDEGHFTDFDNRLTAVSRGARPYE